MRILFVDDDPGMRSSLAEFLESRGHACAAVPGGAEALEKLSEESFDAAVVDLRMPGMDGLELISRIAEAGLSIPLVMASAHGELRDAVEAMRRGAADYLAKPFDPDELLLKLERAAGSILLERTMVAQEAVRGRSAGASSASPAMREAEALIAKAARALSNVLITGASGSGKEVAARRIHEASSRARGPFVPVNLGGLPEGLVESELFGYERGAFTGAEARRLGYFELAQGGTLFLDEVGDMPLHLQVKLLRAIQDRKVSRLGGTKPVPIDIRIIAATNSDLEEMVAERRFREDLYWRLNVVRISIPALKDRSEDVLPLARAFLARYSRETGRRVSGFEPAAERALLRHAFPGNVRELENMVERAVILGEGEAIGAADLGLEGEGAEGGGADGGVPKPGSLRAGELRLIREALEANEWKREETARVLGISRRTLLNKIKEYGILRDRG